MNPYCSPRLPILYQIFMFCIKLGKGLKTLDMIICSWGHYRCMTGYLDALARALMETSNCSRRAPLYYANFNASKNVMGLLQNAFIFEIWPAIIRPKCDLFIFQ